MSKRDDIAKLLTAQAPSRWDALPRATGEIVDRQPYDPLQAYVAPPPLALEGSFPASGWADIVDPSQRNDGTMRYPGPMPFDADIERFAANEAKAPPAPELFGGPGDPRLDDRAKMDQALRMMQIEDSFDLDKAIMSPIDRGHLGYMDVPPVGTKLYRGEPPNPYGIRDKPPSMPMPTGFEPTGQLPEEQAREIEDLLRGLDQERGSQ